MKRVWLVGIFCFLASLSYSQVDTTGYARVEEETKSKQEQQEDIKTLEDVIQGETVRDTAVTEDLEEAGTLPEEAYSAQNKDFQYSSEVEETFGQETPEKEEQRGQSDEINPELLEDLDPEVYEYFNIPQDTTARLENSREKTAPN